MSSNLIPKSPSSKAVYMNVQCGMPYLRQGKPASSFRQLRKEVLEGCGFDFLAKCADMMRPASLKSNKSGVAYRSRHKCGDAFDYDQSSKALAVVQEDAGIQTFFRTWIKCTQQDGSQGIKVTLNSFNAGKVTGYYFDFTECAKRLGWQRIPAHNGWKTKGTAYNLMEFWHYQNTEGLTFDEAMEFLYGSINHFKTNDVRKPPALKVFGLNDRGSAILNLQKTLFELGFITDRKQLDGVYGEYTKSAVQALQQKYGLDADGLVGPQTRVLVDALKMKTKK